MNGVAYRTTHKHDYERLLIAERDTTYSHYEYRYVVKNLERHFSRKRGRTVIEVIARNQKIHYFYPHGNKNRKASGTEKS